MDSTPITYIGKRPEYTDGTYGTRIHFLKDETKLVPADKAILMLKHADVYALGKSKAGLSAPKPVPPKPQEDDEGKLQELRDSVLVMDKESLKDYAQTHFSVKLNGQKGEAILRQEVIGLIDQYGLV